VESAATLPSLAAELLQSRELDLAPTRYVLAVAGVDGVGMPRTPSDVKRRRSDAVVGNVSAGAQQVSLEPLTGLANRRLLRDRLERAIRRCSVLDSVMIVLCLDLDGFENVIAAHGRGTGDALLVSVANVLRTEVRPPDTIARVAVDEFVIVSESLTNMNEAWALAHRLRARIGFGFEIGGLFVNPTVSIGIAIGRASDEGDVLLCNAERAMGRAEAEGGDRVGLFIGRGRVRSSPSRPIHFDRVGTP
jgi:diguanylate cyclase (GGDEF)-like protein